VFFESAIRALAHPYCSLLVRTGSNTKGQNKTRPDRIKKICILFHYQGGGADRHTAEADSNTMPPIDLRVWSGLVKIFLVGVVPPKYISVPSLYHSALGLARAAEDALAEIDEKKKMLEREVKVKKITVNIDKNKCLPLRATFKFDMKTKIEKQELPYSSN
jgi:hypothetical protein